MLSAIESIIEQQTKSNNVFGDLFSTILEKLSENTLSRVRCPLHFRGTQCPHHETLFSHAHAFVCKVPGAAAGIQSIR